MAGDINRVPRTRFWTCAVSGRSSGGRKLPFAAFPFAEGTSLSRTSGAPEVCTWWGKES